MGGDGILTQKAPVDDVFDTRIAIGPNGWGTTDFLFLETARLIDPLRQAFRAAHNGRLPDDASQMLPYATTPEAQTALQKLILRESTK